VRLKVLPAIERRPPLGDPHQPGLGERAHAWR
jgi:hypothetical protein